MHGYILVENQGKDIVNLSGGKYPINIGISLVDSSGNIVNRDYLHIPIEKGRIFRTNESKKVMVNLYNVQEEYNNGNGFRFEIVQEDVSWIDDGSIFYWFE